MFRRRAAASAVGSGARCTSSGRQVESDRTSTQILRQVVDQIIEARKRSGGRNRAEPARVQHARHVEAMSDQPALTLALDVVTGGAWALRDERGSPTAARSSIEACRRSMTPGLERFERHPEIFGVADRLPRRAHAWPRSPAAPPSPAPRRPARNPHRRLNRLLDARPGHSPPRRTGRARHAHTLTINPRKGAKSISIPMRRLIRAAKVTSIETRVAERASPACV